MTTLAAVLSLACLAVGGFHLLRLAVVRVDAIGEVAHAAMGVGMAAMFSPLGDPVPAPLWTAVFVSTGAWFAALALRIPAGSRRSDAVHHVVGAAAMLFMLLGGHGAGAGAADGAHAGHVGHGGGPDGGLGLASVVSIVLAGYFAWHVLRCGDRLRGAAPEPVGGVAVRTQVLRDTRTVIVAHIVTAAAMTVMLLGMV